MSCAPRQSRARHDALAARERTSLPQLPERLRRRAVAQVALGESKRAEGERRQVVEHAVGGERQLERAAADVHHDRAADAEVEVRERAAEARAALRRRRRGRGPGDPPPAERARRTASAFDASRTALVATASMRSAPSCRASVAMRSSASSGALHRRVAELARSIEVGAEPRRRLHLVDDGDRAVGGDVGDDLANRVRADVDRGDAARRSHGGRVSWWLGEVGERGR